MPKQVNNNINNTLNTIELKLKEIWAKVLNKNEIDRLDDFFELGGTSFQIFSVVTLIKEELNVDIPLIIFIGSPNIAKLAVIISEKLQNNYTK